ncbi:MAG: UDP-3-O-(3-hydroxymyristoyl) glucosamine N-acyltransferase [Gammaproteobacteria bacterium]|nr:UDP-3-O-(3-hydroxymyristoyl) glucosamine N-acyltransferase [Gammaproteobacteria bacterium]
MAVSLGELAVRFGCELRGDPETLVEHVATLVGADARSLAFLANPRYKPQLATTQAAAVVLDEASAKDCPAASLVCQNPYLTYARIAGVLHPKRQAPPGVHPSALVAATARIDPTAHVGALCVVGERVVVGPRAVIGPQSHLDDDVTLAEDVYLVARVTVCRGVAIGARTVVQPGVVIGGDGFGFAPERGTWIKVPQVGSVRIGADVEIGANTTIDRGAVDDTVIEEGVKLDNLIQIAHNVQVGAHSVIAACTGVSGSTSIGKRCMIGGGVGFGGHLTIVDDVVITGTTMVSHSIMERGVYSSGIPLEKANTWRRMVARFKRLDRLEGRLKKLEGAAGAPHDQEEDDD